MSQRRQKIEPLDYLEMADAPALRGMTSFLEITPEQASAAKNVALSGREPWELSSEPLVFPKKVSAAEAKKSGEGVVSSPGDAAGVGTVSDTRRLAAPTPRRVTARHVVHPAPESTPDVSSAPGSVASLRYATVSGGETYPGDETRPGLNFVPGRGRSKVRKCVLAQDGHSLGEEAVYQVLWRAGRPESTDPHSARIIRMGSAELAQRINMAKKNARLNVARLFEKLSLEILEDFGTLTSKPRLYRVFSFKQILERRKAAGLEHVLRNKGVVFCTAAGEEIVTPPGMVSSPGVDSIRPASPPERRAVRNQRRGNPPAAPAGAAANREDLAIVSRALSRYWPADEAAASQLISRCREVRPDATADEIALFTADKLEAAVHNPRIKNPTGLILTAVPQCFEGASFEAFRRERAEQRKQPAAPDGELESTLTWMLLNLHPNDSKRQDVQVRLNQIRSSRLPG